MPLSVGRGRGAGDRGGGGTARHGADGAVGWRLGTRLTGGTHLSVTGKESRGRGGAGRWRLVGRRSRLGRAEK
jgi:hypothetical protein